MLLKLLAAFILVRPGQAEEGGDQSAATAAESLAERYVHGYPRFFASWQDDQGRHQGWVIDLMRDMGARADMRFDSVELPAARLRDAIVRGDAHVTITVADYPEYTDAVIVRSAYPVAYLDILAYANDSAPPIQRVEDLRGRTVIVKRGYSYAGLRDFIDDPANEVTVLAEVRDTMQGLQMLTRRNADYFLGYRGNVAPLLEGITFVDDPFLATIQGYALHKAPLYLIVSRAVGDAEELLARLMRGHQMLASEGRFLASGEYRAVKAPPASEDGL